MESKRQTIDNAQPGTVLIVQNQQPTAMSLKVHVHADGTRFAVVLPPGAEASITKGTSRLSISLNEKDADLSARGLTRVQPPA